MPHTPSRILVPRVPVPRIPLHALGSHSPASRTPHWTRCRHVLRTSVPRTLAPHVVPMFCCWFNLSTCMFAFKIPLSSPALQPTAHEAARGGVPKLVRNFAAAAQYASKPPAPRPGQSIAAAFCVCNATAVPLRYGTGTTMHERSCDL